MHNDCTKSSDNKITQKNMKLSFVTFSLILTSTVRCNTIKIYLKVIKLEKCLILIKGTKILRSLSNVTQHN